MRVVFTHSFADDTGGFFVGGVVLEAKFGHSIEHSALDGFESVSCIWESSSDDDAHSVVEVAVLDFAD